MEILASVDEWATTDAENLSAFLETPTGKRLIPSLLKEAPALLEGGETNDILIRSGQVLAFQKMVETLIFLAHPPRQIHQTEPTNYPAPENDAAWDDGQKITPDNTSNSL